MAIRTEPDPSLPRLPGPPTVFREMPLAHAWCRGEGIELGAAAHNPFGLAGARNVAPYPADPSHPDHGDFLRYREEQVRLCGHYALVDLPGEADRIPVPDGSQDYVLSSHVIEHVPDPLGAFLEWKRALRPGGTVFMVFPRPDAPEGDLGRPLTPLAELIQDHETRATPSTHPALFGYRGHYHVFSLASMLELIDWANARLGLDFQVEWIEARDSKVGNGSTVVARSGGRPDRGLAALARRIRNRVVRALAALTLGVGLVGSLGCGGSGEDLDPTPTTAVLASRLQILDAAGRETTDLVYGRTVTFMVELGNPGDKPASIAIPRPPITVAVAKQGFELWASPATTTGGVETRSIPAGGRTTFTLSWGTVHQNGLGLEPGDYTARARVGADTSEERWRIVTPADVPFRVFALEPFSGS